MLDAPIGYNGIDWLNTVTLVGGVRTGCLIEEFDYGRSQGMGYTEKRAQDDGLDASDVYMGARYISLGGTIYGSTIADLFDRLQQIRTAFTPTMAYEASIPDYGYIPLTFSLPTDDPDFDLGAGPVKPLEYRARPVGQPQFTVRRDTGGFAGGGMQGGTGVGASNAGEKGGAISFRVTLECKDPRMYVRPDIWVPFTGAVTGGHLTNRGDYPAPADILLGVTSSPAGSKVEIDIGGSNMTILLGALTNSVVRYSGELKVLTLQTAGSSIDVLRMDMLSFRNNTTHPKVRPGDSDFNVRLYGTVGPPAVPVVLATGTRLMYSESFS